MTATHPPAPTPRRRAITVIALLILILGGASLVALFTASGPTAPPPSPPQAPSATSAPAPPSQVSPQEPDAAPPSEPLPAQATTAAIAGTITNPAGDPIAAATVAISLDALAILSTRSDADGAFLLPELPLEPYTLQVTAPGFAAHSVLAVEPGQPPLEITLGPAHPLEIVVHDAPPQDTSLRCHLGGAGLYPALIQPVHDGRCHFDLGPGHYEVVVTGRTHTSPWREVTTTEQPLTLHLRLAPGYAATTAVHNARTPEESVANALLTLSRTPLHVLALHTTSDARGQARFPALPPGTYQIAARATAFLPYPARPFALPAEEAIRVELDPGVQIRGRVLDENDAPLAARIIARIETPSGARWRLKRDQLARLHRLARPEALGGQAVGLTTTSFSALGDGTFELRGLPDGTIDLDPHLEGWVPTGIVSLQAEPNAVLSGVIVRMRRAAPLLGRVESENGGPIAGATVRWRLPKDLRWGWRDEVTTDKRGIFRYRAVPDHFEAEVRAPGHLTWQRALERPPEGELSVTLTPLAGAINGRVDAPGGAPKRTTIRRTTGDDGVHCRTRSLRNGEFTLEACPPGRQRFEAHADGFAPLWFYAAPGDFHTLSLEVGASITAQITDARGQPGRGTYTLQLRDEAPEAPHEDAPLWRQHKDFTDGHLAVANLPAGTFDLELTLPEHLPLTTTFSLNPNQNKAMGSLRATARVIVTGYVLDALGAPVPHAAIWQDDPLDVTTADASGAYRISLAPGPEMNLRARHWAEGQASLRLDPATAPGSRHDLRLVEPLTIPCPDRLREQGLNLIADERSWRVHDIAPTSPWRASGLARGDYVEGVTCQGDIRIWFVRDGARRVATRH